MQYCLAPPHRDDRFGRKAGCDPSTGSEPFALGEGGKFSFRSPESALRVLEGPPRSPHASQGTTQRCSTGRGARVVAMVRLLRVPRTPIAQTIVR